MPRYEKAPFNKTGEFTCRRTFTFNGRSYVVGQAFNWRNCACSERKLKNLYEGGFLLLDAKKSKAPKAAKKPKPAKKKEVKKTVEEKSEPVVTKEEKEVIDEDIKDFLNDQE